MSDDKENFPKNLIYGYSRAQALEDGVLIHVPNAVYKDHTAVTAEVLEKVGEERMRKFLVASTANRSSLGRRGASSSSRGHGWT